MRNEAESGGASDLINDWVTPSVFPDEITHVFRVQNIRQTDNVGCVGKRTVTAPVLVDGLRQFPHRIRGRTAAAFVDAGEDFVQTDPVAIPEPDGLNPPFCVRGVAFELKRQSNCGFSDSLRIGLRNNTPDFDGVGNQIRPSDLGDLLSRFIMGKTC